MTVVKVLGIVATLMTIVGGAAFIYAYYLVSFNRNQLEGLRNDRDDLITRIELLEADKEDRIRKSAADAEEIAKLEAKVVVLESVLTHDTAINGLIDTVTAHDIKVEQRYIKYMESNQEILAATRELVQLVKGSQ